MPSIPADTSTRRVFAVSTLRSLPPLPELAAERATDVAIEHADELVAWLADPAFPSHASPIADPIRLHLRNRHHVVAIAGLTAHDEADAAHTASDESLERLFGSDLANFRELQSWAHAANAIWITQDHHVFDPIGRLLLDASGKGPDPEAVIPFPADARQRKANCEVQIRNRLVDPVEGLLPLRGAGEICPVDAADVARRAIALFLVATRAESILTGKPLDTERMKLRCPIGVAALSPRERVFFETELTASTQATLGRAATELAWRYEALMALQWALDMQFDLPWPDEHADLTAVTRLMIDLPDEAIVEQARLRSTDEMLDAAELHYQSFHAVASAQQSGRDLSGIYDPGVVCERLVALAWINGLTPGRADWDAASDWVEGGCV
ncbi:DUF4272 domain-containing protein [Aporhodopirellula aestuarii]|uniref:DUF4272 domain-containing protein n=1 Tax=Aporhodopirellula aestuarii TaxID=2950107 RepID=A0ABT0U0L6_9BACT|nr:DUF4272 domain-containing protein [Aporhodopirellula aestuarii]MCM2370414.1 DUF4272 domain-containing protein [Aporhodopirellula aestuarii]